MVAETATSLRRGVAILQALGGEEAHASGGLGVTRIAELIGREKSQVSRALRVLDEVGLVERDPQTQAYRMGWQLFTLGARAGERRLVEAAPPLLRRLVEGLEERAHLSVLHGESVLTLISTSPGRAVEATGWVGRTVPLYCTSSGRVLLFDHGREELDSLLAGIEFRRLGPNTPRSPAEFLERLAHDRTRGFALVDEEFESGLIAAAAPVRDVRGRVVAAVNVSAPKFRFGEHVETAGPEIRRTADHLSRQLGWPGRGR